METGKTTGKNIRVQTVLKHSLYLRLQKLRLNEDRSESKMAAILIEEALNARQSKSE
ncbi:hypothetical protein [Aliamphritea ceti]|uniref:hypothetical protein n=1 Tax=Aliamphritea ceti TaxID=1524258 RepID=UPI0021C31CA7|nr:hypothetical protein [Aliamphritea ceti]